MRIKLQVELDVEVIDEALLKQASLAKMDAADIEVDDGDEVEAVKEEERDRIREGDLGEALIALVDPYDLIPDGAGVECHGSVHGVGTVDASVQPREDRPDFDALFDLCRCREEERFSRW